MTEATRADFYLSPEGDDTWSGRLPEPNRERTDGPFATLSRARDAIRLLKRQKPAADLTVLIRGGTYRLPETVRFTLEDSAGKERTITYAAYPGEEPTFSSGVPIRGWRRLADDPAGLPAAARGRVWVADVSGIRSAKEALSGDVQADGAWRFFTLYAGGTRLPRACGRGFNPSRVIPRGKARDRRVVHFPPGALADLPNLRDAELVIVPCFFWVMNILPIESVDEAANSARTTAAATYPMGKNGMTDRDNAWVENVLPVLDQPGEWVLDTSTSLLYLWPLADEPGADIVAPLLTELIRIEGGIDYDGPMDRPVENLAFKGVTFTHGDRYPWSGGTGWGLQHDWEMFDRPTALVRLRGAEDCVVEDCRFTNSGHTAIRLDLHCRRNRIAGNRIDRMGGAGVLLAGYGPGTKDVNTDNQVTNNYIHHIGEIYWGSAAIFAWQSGRNRIAHNYIHSIPYTGIVVSGRIAWDPKGQGECSRTVRWKELGIDPEGKRPRWSWQQREPFLHGRRNRVEYNDIHDAMRILGDGNCIYISGTGTGNVVRGNYCHDCTGRYMNAVIRCDDDQHGTLIEGNILCRTRGYGEGIISKGDNDIVNNVIADLRPDGGHRGYIVFPYGSPAGSKIQRNILYSCQPGQILYHQNRGRRAGGPVPRLRDTDADRNLYHCTVDPDWAELHLRTERKFGIETNSLAADPGFVALERGDFRFRSGSPAPALGIPPLDPARAGLEEPYRQRFIGPTVRCRIRPAGCELRKPAFITIEADTPGVRIHFTLDGTRPTARSPLYTGPFELTEGAMVRARAFGEGARDLVGAAERFTSPPPPIREDFEAVPVGGTTPAATTREENEQFTARVSDERADKGRHSLKFRDGPGQKHPFNPHVYYRTRFTSGLMVGRFSLWIDENTTLYYQWRDYGKGFSSGPTVRILPGGRLVFGDDELMVLPRGQWIRFKVTCRLGAEAPLAFDLEVDLPGDAPPKRIAGLVCEPGFKKLDWLGLVANGTQETVFYVDQLELGPGEEP